MFSVIYCNKLIQIIPNYTHYDSMVHVHCYSIYKHTYTRICPIVIKCVDLFLRLCHQQQYIGLLFKNILHPTKQTNKPFSQPSNQPTTTITTIQKRKRRKRCNTQKKRKFHFQPNNNKMKIIDDKKKSKPHVSK